jgi:hypothetical protein
MLKHAVAAIILTNSLALTGLAAAQLSEPRANVLLPIAEAEGCLIKGNISKSGERIYHVPGGKFYDRTKINPGAGERWFCSEEEATAAGWRRSMR